MLSHRYGQVGSGRLAGVAIGWTTLLATMLPALAVPTASAQDFVWPARDATGNPAHTISTGQDYGAYVTWRDPDGYHAGIDIAPNTCNDPNHQVWAAASGTIIDFQKECPGCYPDPGNCDPHPGCGCGFGSGFGNYVIIEHEGPYAGLYSLYAHLNSVDANIYDGAHVDAGQFLGMIGTTGASSGIHLHFEVRDFPGLGSPNESFAYSDDVPDGEGYFDPR